ncbi:hypothetical protein ACWGDE_16195 [Streptomyces sp. NPDC054956]
MDDTGRASVALAVALRDTHFRLKALARSWEERAAAGVVQQRESLGPTWQYSDDPDLASYADGQVIVLANGICVIFQLAIRFGGEAVDMLASINLEDDDEVFMELLSTGPEEFPVSGDDLVTEIGRCLEQMERVDLASVLRG